MDEDKIIAAILTVALHSGTTKGVSGPVPTMGKLTPKDVVDDYERVVEVLKESNRL